MTANPEIKNESTASMPLACQSGKMSQIYVDHFRAAILHWYDKHQRTLPWRAGTGITPDPYHVWLSEIMLQQTVVAAVIPYFVKFVDKWPTVAALAHADQEDIMQSWAGLGYYSRARNLHKCAKVIVSDYGGVFPDEQDILKKLPGIGDYTSAAITSIAFNKPAVVIDGNVDRVMARYFGITEPLPQGKKQIRQYASALSQDRTDRPGDYAQALMDLGATVCTPKSSKCVLCPINKNCSARERGTQESLPAKLKKQPRPKRYGRIYWIKDGEGGILLERRPEKGLLAGTIGLPTSTWENSKKAVTAPDFLTSIENMEPSGLKVHHVFTHFELELLGQSIEIKDKNAHIPDNFFWHPEKDLKSTGMPTVFKKFVNLMLQNGKGDENEPEKVYIRG